MAITIRATASAVRFSVRVHLARERRCAVAGGRSRTKVLDMTRVDAAAIVRLATAGEGG